MGVTGGVMEVTKDAMGNDWRVTRMSEVTGRMTGQYKTGMSICTLQRG